MTRALQILLAALVALASVLYLTKPEKTPARKEAPASLRTQASATPPEEAKIPVTPAGAQAAPQAGRQDSRAPLDPEQAAARWNSLSSLLTCIEGGKCAEALPNDTPSSQYFAARDRILDEVEWFKARAPRGPEQEKRSLEAAHALLARLPDEMVQLSVLEWLLALPPDPQTPLVITRNLRDVVDVDLIQAIVKLFERDRHPTNSAAINEYVFVTIDRGATLASIEMAKALPRLLTEENRAEMQKLLNVVPKGTEREKYLKLAFLEPSVWDKQSARRDK